jgi:hypothetical protein
MDSFNNLTEKKNMPQLLLVILFIIYLIFNFKTPEVLANVVDSSLGKIVVALVALFLFSYSNPILGVLGIIVAYQLIKTSSIQTGTEALEKYYPTEQKKWSPFTPIHQFPYTLEQEMVKLMASQKFNTNYVKAPYRPVLDDTYDASPIINGM